MGGHSDSWGPLSLHPTCTVWYQTYIGPDRAWRAFVPLQASRSLEEKIIPVGFVLTQGGVLMDPTLSPGTPRQGSHPPEFYVHGGSHVYHDLPPYVPLLSPSFLSRCTCREGWMGAPVDTHGVSSSSEGTRQAPESSWSFLPQWSRWAQVSLQSMSRDIRPHKAEVRPLVCARVFWGLAHLGTLTAFSTRKAMLSWRSGGPWGAPVAHRPGIPNFPLERKNKRILFPQSRGAKSGEGCTRDPLTPKQAPNSGALMGTCLT